MEFNSRLYSPSLKDAAWLEDAHLTFLFSIHLSVNFAGWSPFMKKIY